MRPSNKARHTRGSHSTDFRNAGQHPNFRRTQCRDPKESKMQRANKGQKNRAQKTTGATDAKVKEQPPVRKNLTTSQKNSEKGRPEGQSPSKTLQTEAAGQTKQTEEWKAEAGILTPLRMRSTKGSIRWQNQWQKTRMVLPKAERQRKPPHTLEQLKPHNLIDMTEMRGEASENQITMSAKRQTKPKPGCQKTGTQTLASVQRPT